MIAFAAFVAACSDPPSAGPEPAVSAGATTPAPAKPELVPIPGVVSDGPGFIRDEQARAERDGKKLVVYVGATWCEPCQAFHRALESGELDKELAGVRFLDFDLDTHGALLDAAACSSKMIPLFSRATTEGTCNDRRFEGGIKGNGAVMYMLPRLKSIL